MKFIEVQLHLILLSTEWIPYIPYNVPPCRDSGRCSNHQSSEQTSHVKLSGSHSGHMLQDASSRCKNRLHKMVQVMVAARARIVTLCWEM